MIIQLKSEISSDQIKKVTDLLLGYKWQATEVKTQSASYLVAIGNQEIDIRAVGALPGVKDVHRVTDPYKLVSKKWKAEPTRVPVGTDLQISADSCTVVLGPCAIESEEQIDSILAFLKEQGVRFLRGGAFKPRTSPYSFRGLGIDGLKMCYQKASALGIKVISEVVSAAEIDLMYPYIDVYQVGARNTQNFTLLHELGRIDKPVLLKRGISGTIEELLQSAEYIFANGNERLILCERGIRTFEKSYRNTLDLNAVPVLKEKSHLPVFVDPSHGIGIRKHVEQMALAAVMAGADGLLVEIHPRPEEALSDAAQTLNFAEAAELVRKVNQVLSIRE